MRHSSFLLALSLALHVIDNHVTEATAETVNDPNKAHTFLEIKKNTRLQGSNEGDERMFRASLEKIISFFSEKTPEAYFNKFLRGAVGTSDIEMLNAGLQTMKHKEMKRAVDVFKRHNMFLADKVINKWGIEAFATALVKAKHSEDENIKKNAATLLDDLAGSLDKPIGRDYEFAFRRLKLNDKDREFAGFIDGRVEVLDDLIQLHYGGEPNDLFVTLAEGFKSHANLASFIALAAAKDIDAKVFETRFVEYLAESVKVKDIIYVLGLTRFEYKMFHRPEYEMVKEFCLLKKIPQDKIQHHVLDALIEAKSRSKRLVALMLSNGVEMEDDVSKVYEQLLFESLFAEKGNNLDGIKSIFTLEELDSDLVQNFLKRYQQWHAEVAKKQKRTIQLG